MTTTSLDHEWCGRIAGVLVGRLAKVGAAITSPASIAAALGVAIVFAIELRVLGWQRSSLRRVFHPTRSTWTDLFWFALRILGLGSLVAAIWSLGLTVVASRLAARYAAAGVLDRIAPPLVRVPLYLLLTDLLNYWIHRASHRIAWWWELHKLHHSAIEMNGITTARLHPLDTAAIAVASAVPAALLGGSEGDSIVVLTLLGAHAAISHSMVPWTWGWFGQYVVRSPVGHRIHHSPLREHVDKNFASIFPVWDWMFDTLYTGRVVNEEVGVDANFHNARGLAHDLIESTRRAVRALAM